MPLGYERLNVRKSVPNKNVVFIKPLPGTTEAMAMDYLERIAAQCLPVMNKHSLAVASLEEYQPNTEFWGRNFNCGEVIQLVLRSPTSGQWLPFKFVQMVMMHELAHIHQMNHSKAFWTLRNEYSAEMKSLWERGYTGDGLWGKGVLLENGAFARENLELGENLPEHMCGGTFTSRRSKKRKLKPKITYKEQKERRIRKKFGAHGVTLGADEATKSKLEKGKRPIGKPRVAGSVRGRELRAAAALSRFEIKAAPETADEDLVTDSDTDSDSENSSHAIKTEASDAVDIDGAPLLDPEGLGMVKVCGDEDDNDIAKAELAELQDFDRIGPNEASTLFPQISIPNPPKVAPHCTSTPTIVDKKPAPIDPSPVTDNFDETRVSPCPVCSFNNVSTALSCGVCSNVLQPDFVPDWWHCKSSVCKESVYINAGDVGRCGICGSKHSMIDQA